jgi:hypothetical protein
MRLTFMATAMILPLAACETNSDPAAGGFINGLAGVTTGAYDARITAGEAAVAESQARNDALQAEQSALAAQIASTERSLASARFTLLNQRDAATNLDAATAAQVNAVLAAQPTGNTEAERLASLQQLLAQTSALSRDLASLGA